MIHELKPYPAYRDSGVEWLGEVPEDWEVRRNKLFLREVNERSEDGSEELLTVSQYTGVTRRRETLTDEGELLTNAASLVGYRRVMSGDLVMNIMLAWNGSLGVSAIEGIVSPAYCVFRARTHVEHRFLHYLFRTTLFTGVFKTASTGVVDSRLRLYPDVFSCLPSLLPPLPEQSAIVRFLDRVDRCIRRCIRAKQRLIALLGEQKQAIIHRAVTRGLDPDVRLKPSGVEWLGDVPEHWDVRRLKTLVLRIDQGVSPQAENHLSAEGSWGVLKAGCVNKGVFKETEHKRLPRGFVFNPSLAVKVGDVLVSRASGSPHLVGSVGRIRSLAYSLILSDKTFRPVFNKEVDPDFMVLTMNSRYYRHQVEQAISGAEGLANNLPLSSLRAFPFTVPPPSEQRSIVESVSRATSALAIAIGRAEREISLLREYRPRLIADVVTGKLDVREAAARLPEETGEPEPLDDTDTSPGDISEETEAPDPDALEEAEA